jgi:hypothetical protein
MTEEATPREVGSNDQLGAGPEALYCYSTNEEEYYGAFNSREEALAEATAELEGYDEPGETRKVWTGVQKPAMHFLRKSTEHLGRDFAERIEEWLADNIAAEEEIVEVKDYAALGAALLDVLEQHATFNRWAVDQVHEHEAIVPGEPEAPNAEFSGPPAPLVDRADLP